MNWCSLILTFLAFSNSHAIAEEDAPWNVRSFGSLRAMFHEGDVGPVVQLDALLPDENLYAVGALAGLRGEITIVAGVAHVERPDGLSRDAEPQAACLLVVAEVDAWVEVETQGDLALSDLGDAIEKIAGSIGLETDRAFPFLIEGVVNDLGWHVIDGRRLSEGGSSHQEHLGAAEKHRREAVQATLLGFYSRRHQGVFTHRGSQIHVHAIVGDEAQSGHVDHVVLPAGSRLRFPDPSSAEGSESRHE